MGRRILPPRHRPPRDFRRAVEKRSRFLKKAAQKLLLRWVMGVVADNAHDPD
jgi:hypothetical protein